MLGRHVDLAQMSDLLRVQRAAMQQVGEAEYGVHRRADFMAHVRQEGTLRAIGLLGLPFCLFEFDGALHHLLLQTLIQLGQSLLGLLELGDILLDGQIIHDRAILLAHRRHLNGLDILGTILAFIDELAAPGLAANKMRPHVLVGSPRGLSGLQDARIFPEHFSHAVTRGFLKILVGILDRTIQIGNHHGIGALLDSLHQPGERRVLLAAFADVAHDGHETRRGPLLADQLEENLHRNVMPVLVSMQRFEGQG